MGFEYVVLWLDSAERALGMVYWYEALCGFVWICGAMYTCGRMVAWAESRGHSPLRVQSLVFAAASWIMWPAMLGLCVWRRERRPMARRRRRW